MYDLALRTVWVEELCGYLRELAEAPTEKIDNKGTCILLDTWVVEHGGGLFTFGWEECMELGKMFSCYSGEPAYPVGGQLEYGAGFKYVDYGCDPLWDNDLRREYALELADRIEEAWEAALCSLA